MDDLQYFSKNFFLQSIEGARSVINDLYAKLMQDPRHEDVQIIEFIEIVKQQLG